MGLDIKIFPHMVPRVDFKGIREQLLKIIREFDRTSLLQMLGATSVLPGNTIYSCRWELLMLLTAHRAEEGKKKPTPEVIGKLFEEASNASWEIIEDFQPIETTSANWLLFNKKKYYYLPGALEIPIGLFKEIFDRILPLQLQIADLFEFSARDELIAILEAQTKIVEFLEQSGRSKFQERGAINVPSEEFIEEFTKVIESCSLSEHLWSKKCNISLPSSNLEVYSHLENQALIDGKPYCINEILIYFKRRLLQLMSTSKNPLLKQGMSDIAQTKVLRSLLEVLPFQAIMPKLQISGMSALFDYGFIMDKKLFAISVVEDSIDNYDGFEERLREKLPLSEELQQHLERSKNTIEFKDLEGNSNTVKLQNSIHIMVTDNLVEKDMGISGKLDAIPCIIDIETFEYIFEDLLDRKETPLELWKIIMKEKDLKHIKFHTFADFYDFLSNRRTKEEPMLWNDSSIGYLNPHFSSSVQNARTEKRPLVNINPVESDIPFTFKVVKGEKGHYIGYNNILNIKFDCIVSENTYYILTKSSDVLTRVEDQSPQAIKSILIYYLLKLLKIEDIENLANTPQIIIHVEKASDETTKQKLDEGYEGVVIAGAKDNEDNGAKHFLIAYDEDKFTNMFATSPRPAIFQILGIITQQTLSKERHEEFMDSLRKENIENQYRAKAAITYSDMSYSNIIPASHIDIVEADVKIHRALAGKYEAGTYNKGEAAQILNGVVSFLRGALKEKIASYKLSSILKRCYEELENGMRHRKKELFSFSISSGMEMNYDVEERFAESIRLVNEHLPPTRLLIEQACAWGINGTEDPTLTDWQECLALSHKLLHYVGISEFFYNLSDVVHIELKVDTTEGFNFEIVLKEDYGKELVKEQVNIASGMRIREIERAEEIGKATKPNSQEFKSMTKELGEKLASNETVKEMSTEMKKSFGFDLPEYVSVMVGISKSTKDEEAQAIVEVSEADLVQRLVDLTGYTEDLVRNVLIFSTIPVGTQGEQDVQPWLTTTRENRIAVKPLICVEGKYLFGLESLAFGQDNVTDTILNGQWPYSTKHLPIDLVKALNKQQLVVSKNFETQVAEKIRETGCIVEERLAESRKNNKCLENIKEPCPGEIDSLSIDEKRKLIILWEAKDLLPRYGWREIALDVNQFLDPKKGIRTILESKKEFINKYKGEILKYYKIDDDGWNVQSVVVLSKLTMLKAIISKTYPVITFDQIKNYLEAKPKKEKD